jgi:hypothetical protein
LRARSRREFHGEMFPVGSHERRIHHAAVEYSGNVIGDGKNWWGWERADRHQCDARECQRTTERQPKGDAAAMKHRDGEQATCGTAPDSWSNRNRAGGRDGYSHRDRSKRDKEWFVDPQTIQSLQADKFSGNQAACKELEIDPGPIPTRIEEFVCSSQAKTTKVL